jgi:hypothetical protein
LAGLPYFVICSTIEPRKNHLLILQVWRELVQREGAGAPKLVIVGGRGWKFEAVAALLDRSPVLRGHVIEVRPRESRTWKSAGCWRPTTQC